VNRLLRSAAVRWALEFVGIAVAVLAAFAVLLWVGTHQMMERELAALIESDTRAVMALVADHGVAAAAEAIHDQVGRDIDEDEIIALADGSFRLLAGNLPAWPLEIRPEPGWYDVNVVRGGQAGQARVLHSAIGDGAHLIVGRDLADLLLTKSLFIAGLAGAALVVATCGLVGGVLVRRVLLRRLTAINHTAAAIVRGDLTRRLPTRGTGDELELLAQTINRMLDQIEQLVHGVRNVSNTIAHDLRTPLAELRTRLEQFTVTHPTAEEAAAEIEGAVADVDRVIGIFNALLRLAEIDAGVRRSGFVTVDLGDLLAQVVEFYEPSAEQKGIALTADVPKPVAVTGDPNLLAQAVGNLIDNALKYADGGGKSVRVSASVGIGRSVEITVADSGPGIPDAEKPKVLERFYRGDRSRATAGTGLGLSVVAAVTKLHGGSIRLADNEPGLRVILTLPEPIPLPPAAAPLGTVTA
jgi:signal transduction histidine kinase